MRALILAAAATLAFAAAPAIAQESGAFAAAAQRLQMLEARAQRMEDERAIENLMRAYGYYVDRKMWDDVADLFAEGGTFETGQRGVYRGRDHIRAALEDLWGPQDLQDGQMNDHLVLQPVIHVAADGTTAMGRFRHIGMLGEYQDWGRWEDGIYENAFVKEDGVWKISALHLYTILSTDIEQGWGEQAFPAEGPSEAAPPDAPPTLEYDAYPAYYTPPFHYPNPVSGQKVTYREGDPGAAVDPQMRPAAPQPDAGAPTTLDELEAALADAELRLERVKAANEIQNLINAYGYYLDKGLYNELADLFAEDGSMELAQRGVYQGRERVRDFLVNGLGRGAPTGPREGFLQDHVQLQPVIHVSEDAQTATARMRAIMIMGFAGRSASWGAGVYVDEFVKEDGRWKFKTAHVYNTFNAAYDGAWVRNSAGALPGQNPDLPPDSPPTMEFEYWPTVYDIPFAYDNPVSGRAPYSYRDGE